MDLFATPDRHGRGYGIPRCKRDAVSPEHPSHHTMNTALHLNYFSSVVLLDSYGFRELRRSSGEVLRTWAFRQLYAYQAVRLLCKAYQASRKRICALKRRDFTVPTGHDRRRAISVCGNPS